MCKEDNYFQVTRKGWAIHVCKSIKAPEAIASKTLCGKRVHSLIHYKTDGMKGDRCKTCFKIFKSLNYVLILRKLQRLQ